MSDLFNKLVLRRKGTSCRVAASPSRNSSSHFWLLTCATAPETGPCAAAQLGAVRGLSGEHPHIQLELCDGLMLGSESCQGGALQGKGGTGTFWTHQCQGGGPLAHTGQSFS